MACSTHSVYSGLYLEYIFVLKQGEGARGNTNSNHAYTLYTFYNAVAYISLGLRYTRAVKKIHLQDV